MRKIFLYFMNVMTLCMTAFLVSCSKDSDVEAPDPNPEPIVAQPTTYTVMLYGSGGGDLDEALNYNLAQIEGQGKTSRVNFTALVKYSVPYQTAPETQGTRLLTLTSDGLKSEQKYDVHYRLDNPAHLADFIRESKEKMPADKYILVFWNHGDTFGPADKPVQPAYPEGAAASRAVVYDDSTKCSLSIFELEKGVKDSGVKPDLIYFDVCMMGMAENFYQLKDCSRYIMASSHSTPKLGGDYTRLLGELQENDSLADAIKAYVPATVTNWKTTESDTVDLACYDMQYMDELALHVKTAAAEVLALKKKYTDIPEAAERNDQTDEKIDWFIKTQNGEENRGIVYPFEEELASVDLCSLLTRLAAQYTDGTLSSAATHVRQTVEKMTVASSSARLPEWLDRVSMGVNWPTDAYIGLKSDAYDQALRNSAFCQATGWDKIMLDTENPKISKVKSAYFEAYYHYIGKLSPYTYSWTATLSVDESQLNDENREAVSAIVAEVNGKSAATLSALTYPLRASSDIAYDLYWYASDKYQEELQNLGVTKVKVHAQLKDGQAVNPKDADASKYAASADREFEIS